MPTHDFWDCQCYIVYDDGKQSMKLSGLKNITLLTEDNPELFMNDSAEAPCSMIHIDCEATFTLPLNEDSVRQMRAVLYGYRNYNCMQRAIRRQKRKLKEMRKRAKKEKHGRD